ncbi:hypothetical protein HQ520_12110 [bacterium]|nr:hypothetical protein [bacterium]
MKNTGKAAEIYICPKCRGRQPHVREVALVKTSLFGIFPCRDNRYIEVTCTLCGYTEFYNRAIYQRAQAEAPAKESLPFPEKTNGS